MSDCVKKHLQSLIIRSIVLYVFLYLSFLMIGGGVMWGCWLLLRRYWINGGESDFPLPGVIVLFMGGLLLVYEMLRVWGKVLQIVRPDLKQVEREEAPLLFHLIEEVATEMKVSCPEKVYFSATASASVFFEPGLKNWLFPEKKNLEIGTGLFYFLDREELRAVIAHELGHFSQDAMKWGGPVYVIGQQMRFWIRATRDKDSGIIGKQYYMFLFLFRVIVGLLFRKLSKDYPVFTEKLEFEADRLAAGYVGKQALISALWKVTFASRMFGLMMRSSTVLLQHGKKIADFYEVQYWMAVDYANIHEWEWEEKWGTAACPGIEISEWVARRIALLEEEGSEERGQVISHVRACDLIPDFTERCRQLTQLIYQEQFHVNDTIGTRCGERLLRNWVTHCILQLVVKERSQTQNAVKLQIILQGQQHRLPLVDCPFDVCWDNRVLGQGRYRRGFVYEIDTTIGDHDLKFVGEYIKPVVLEVHLSDGGICKLWLDYKYSLRNSEYRFFIKQIDKG